MLLLCLLFLLWCLGQVLRDLTWLTAFLFYIPSPLLAGLAILHGVACLCKRSPRNALLAAGIAVLPIYFVLFVENHFCRPRQEPPPGTRIRLVHWNVYRGRLGVNAVMRRLANENAHIYVLSEGNWEVDIDETRKVLGERYQGRRVGDMLVFARGELHKRKRLVKHEGLRLYDISCRVQNTNVSLYVADVGSSLLIARKHPIEELFDFVRQGQPDLVVGDFNAPRRSRGLCPLPPNYSHAYESAGSGWSYSWPSLCPVYAIDQCIAGSRVTPLRYRLKTSILSDHRMQVFDLVLTPAGTHQAAPGAEGMELDRTGVTP